MALGSHSFLQIIQPQALECVTYSKLESQWVAPGISGYKALQDVTSSFSSLLMRNFSVIYIFFDLATQWRDRAKWDFRLQHCNLDSSY